MPPLAAACLASFVASLAVRLAFVLSASHSPYLDHRLIDEQDYDGLAKSLLAGRWPGSEALFRPPLYPMLLAAIYRVVGDNVVTVRLAQVGLGALAAPLTAWIAHRVLGSTRAALGAGLAVALCGPLVYYDAQLLAASLDVLLVLLTTALLLRADGSGHARDWLLAGAALGLSALNRGSMLLVVPVVVIWSVATRPTGKAWRAVASRMGIFVATATLVVAPLAWHNAKNDDRPEASYAPDSPVPPSREASVGETLARVAGGRFCALGWADGVNLYMGNRPDWAGVNRDADPEHFAWFKELNAEPWAHGATTAHEHSAWFQASVRSYVRSHPIDWLRLALHKGLEVVNGYEVPRGTSPYAERTYATVLALLLWDEPLRVPSGLLIPLGIAGAWALRRHRPAQLVCVVLFAQLAFVVAFFVTSRYRAPALPLLTVLAAGLVAQAIRRGRDMGLRGIASPIEGAAVAVLVVVSNVRLAGQTLGRGAVEEYDLGVELAGEGKSDAAIEHFRSSLSVSPDYAPPHVYLGLLRQREGDVDGAISEYALALRRAPKDAYGHNALGTALLSRHDLDGAEREFRAAAAAERRYAEPRFWMGYVRLTRRDAAGAVEWLDEARRLGFADPRLAPLLETARRQAPEAPTP